MGVHCRKVKLRRYGTSQRIRSSPMLFLFYQSSLVQIHPLYETFLTFLIKWKEEQYLRLMDPSVSFLSIKPTFVLSLLLTSYKLIK